MSRILKIVGVLLLLVVGFTGYEIMRNNAVEKIPARDRGLKLNVNTNQVLLDMSRGQPYDSQIIDDAATYVNRRFDTSDFRLQSLIRIIHRYRDDLIEDDYQTIRSTFLNFKYWMDQPGHDSMCYWSENHQLLFASSEFLAGQYWPDEVFSNAGLTGREHQALARERIMTWLEQRWLYGFTEWYSNTYYEEDIAPLANLIDFVRDDEELVVKAQIILDLLLYDVASQSYQGSFISSSGRMYARGKRYAERTSMNAVIDSIWDPTPWGREASDRVGMGLNFQQIRNYEVPGAIYAIGRDSSEVVIKASTGLNLDELEGEGLLGQEDPQIMMQWAMEAFSNPEVIDNSVTYMNRQQMFGSEFLHDFGAFNLSLLRYTGALPPISRWLDPVTNGVAIQRANTYTYRTADYMVATAQAYHPGTFGDQQHLWNAVLSRDVSVFTIHPAKPLSDKGALSGSPGYWVGSGRFPHVVQDRNVVLNIYQIPDKTGFMEKSIQDFTHAHFPQERFDEVIVDGRYAFGRTGDSYGAFVALNPLHYAEGTSDDLVQPGKDSYWVFEAGAASTDGSFEAFMQRIRGNAVSYEGGHLSYVSHGRTLELQYQGDFSIAGEVQDLDYPRFDSPYVRAPRKPQEAITIAHDGQSLELDFYRASRVISQVENVENVKKGFAR